MAKLRILLPSLRDRCGSAVLASRGEILFGPFRVLGTANPFISRRHGNPEHDRLLPFGDPPTGAYVVAELLPPGVAQQRFPRLGSGGGVVLEPTDGAAATAARGGRNRVLLHGGRLDKRGRLRRTRGGFRIAHADLLALFDAIERTRAAGDPFSAVEVIDIALGFEGEPVLGPARRRRTHRATTATAGSAFPLVGAAMALFGVTRSPSTRRRFLAQTLGAIAGAVLLDACGIDGPCTRACDGEGSNTSTGSGGRCGGSAGSGSGG